MKKTLFLITLIAISSGLSQTASAKNYSLQNKPEFDLVQQNAEEGDAYFQAVLGQSLLYGLGVKQDKKKGLSLINQSANLKNALGLSSLCRAYYGEITDIKLKPKAANLCRESFSDLVKLADRGDAYAQSNLGYMYDNGLGVNKDLKEALRWYQKAAEEGNLLAQNNLGKMYENGTGVNQNLAEAVKWYQKAADKGEASAQNNLGRMYENGTGVDQNLTEAVKWYRKAADQDNHYSMHNLGRLYLEGSGIKQDYKEAYHLFKKSADKGFSSSKTEMAKMLFLGKGHAKNNDLALTLVSEAIRESPQNIDNYSLKSLIHKENGEEDKAIEMSTKAINLAPQNPFYWAARASIYEKDYPEKAIYDYSQVILYLKKEAKPLRVEALYRRAFAYFRVKKHSLAIKDLTTVLNLDPNGKLSYQAYILRGAAYYESNNFSRAVYDLKMGLKDKNLSVETKNNAEMLLKQIQVASQSPTQVTNEFYRAYQLGEFYDSEGKLNFDVLANYVTQSLLHSLYNEENTSPDGHLWHDPFIGAQIGMRSFKTLSQEIKGNIAYVKVRITYDLPAKKNTINVKLRFDKGWYIDDLIHESGHTIKR